MSACLPVSFTSHTWLSLLTVFYPFLPSLAITTHADMPSAFPFPTHLPSLPFPMWHGMHTPFCTCHHTLPPCHILYMYVLIHIYTLCLLSLYPYPRCRAARTIWLILPLLSIRKLHCMSQLLQETWEDRRTCLSAWWCGGVVCVTWHAHTTHLLSLALASTRTFPPTAHCTPTTVVKEGSGTGTGGTWAFLVYAWHANTNRCFTYTHACHTPTTGERRQTAFVTHYLTQQQMNTQARTQLPLSPLHGL